MNNRIKLLAVQAHAVDNTLHYYNPEFIEKFAKLIIQECANIDFRHKVGLSSDDVFEISKVIKQHFGIE